MQLVAWSLLSGALWACFCLSSRNSESLGVKGGERKEVAGSWFGSCLCLFQVHSQAGKEPVLP